MSLRVPDERKKQRKNSLCFGPLVLFFLGFDLLRSRVDVFGLLSAREACT
jgi:hypothetical protein